MTLPRRAALAAPAVLLPLAASPAWSGASDPADAVRSAERHAVALGAALTGLTRRTGAEGWVFHLCETWGPPPFHQHAFAGWGSLSSFHECAPVAGHPVFSESQPACLALRDGALSISWR